MKRIFAVTLSIILMIGLIFGVENQITPEAKAATNWYLEKSSVTVPYGGSTQIKIKNLEHYELDYVDSSNTDIVYADYYYDYDEECYYLELNWEGIGKATVTVIDYDGDSRTCQVTCKGKDPVAPHNWSLAYYSKNISYNDSNTQYLAVKGCGELLDVKSTNDNVVEIVDYYYDDYDDCCYVEYKRGERGGKANILVTGDDGTVKTCSINCEYSKFTLGRKTLVFGKRICWTNYWICFYENTDAKLKSVKSSKPSVASAKKKSGCLVITPKKRGVTHITAKDTLGRVRKMKVKVKGSYFKANLKYESWTSISYGDKTIYGYTKPKARVKLKIGGKTYSKKAKKSGRFRIKLKKMYKLKTKYRVKYRYKGRTYVQKSKIYSATSLSSGTVWSCRRYVPITVYNIHKGDVVTMKAGNETYRKKFKRSYNSYSFEFYTDYTMRNYYRLRFKIKNKYKQKLYSHTRYLNW